MEKDKIYARLTPAVLGACLILTLAGCQSGPLPVPPPPEISSLVTTAATPSSTTLATAAGTSDANTPSTTFVSVPPASTPAGLTALRVDSNTAVISFPDKITFALKGTNPQTIKAIALEYGTDQRSLTSQTIRTELDFRHSSEVTATWDWQMKKTGSVPPGATVWWQWILTDINGNILSIPRQTLAYTDTRFEWQVKKLADMDIYWYGQNENLVYTLAEAVHPSLSRIQLNVTIPAERKPKVMLYSSSEEIKSAVLFSHEWTGALAFSSYNIILTAVNKDNLEWAKGALPHELTHLLVGEAVFGPFGNIPTWLNEGLAMYSGGQGPDYMQDALNAAVRTNNLISIRSLAGSFPADSSSANLAYAESRSLVVYMIGTYGWEKMRSLLAVFKDGATYDQGLQAVYQMDVDALEAKWRAFLKVP